VVRESLTLQETQWLERQDGEFRRQVDRLANELAVIAGTSVDAARVVIVNEARGIAQRQSR
jgi:hypothetical protein